MPRMAAVLAVLGLTAFSIGFNIVRYPAVRDTAAKLADAAPRSEASPVTEPTDTEAAETFADKTADGTNDRQTDGNAELEHSAVTNAADDAGTPLVSYTWGPSNDEELSTGRRAVEVQRVEAQKPDRPIPDSAATAWNAEAAEDAEENAFETAENAGFVGDRYRLEGESQADSQAERASDLAMNDDVSTAIDESDKSDETMSSSRNAQPRNT
ncbi:MAG: hypothetical protein D6741_00840, partial [Planctomycetota bacterium]